MGGLWKGLPYPGIRRWRSVEGVEIVSPLWSSRFAEEV